MNQQPRLLLFTMGDVAGIGPEIIAKAWPQLVNLCRPVVVGDPLWLEKALRLEKISAKVARISRPDELTQPPKWCLVLLPVVKILPTPFLAKLAVQPGGQLMIFSVPQST